MMWRVRRAGLREGCGHLSTSAGPGDEASRRELDIGRERGQRFCGTPGVGWGSSTSGGAPGHLRHEGGERMRSVADDLCLLGAVQRGRARAVGQAGLEEGRRASADGGSAGARSQRQAQRTESRGLEQGLPGWDPRVYSPKGIIQDFLLHVRLSFSSYLRVFTTVRSNTSIWLYPISLLEAEKEKKVKIR